MITNISGYRFVRLQELDTWQAACHERCLALGLKGTVVWSQEGMNVMLSGIKSSIFEWINWLNSFPELQNIEFKFSESDSIPFKRMLNKIKVALVPGCADPLEEKATNLSALELQQWYAEGKDFIIIDTRNTYETAVGKFKDALDIQITEFKEFSHKIATLPTELKEKPVVLYCTGGIRCEKAAPLAQKAGFKEVYQLEGGILKYFEICGRTFYEGDCFVFDERRKV